MNVLLMSLMDPPKTSSLSDTPIVDSLIGISIVVLVIIVIRELLLRYWKINIIIKNQENTNLMIKKYMESKGFEFTDDEISRLKS